MWKISLGEGLKSGLTDLCNGRFPVGLFYFDKALWTDAGVRQASETGADFFVSVESSPELLSLCEKFDLGVFSVSNITPVWWGGDGKNAGGYREATPLGKLYEVKDNYPDSQVLWGDYIVDEPNSVDFAHIGKVVKLYKELFPGKIPLINLYPCYASMPSNTHDEVIMQLGNSDYTEHIDQYIQEIDLPYICFDYYPFTGVFADYLENLRVIAAACKNSGKEMWVIIQSGAWSKEQILEEFQLDWQVYICLAFGVSSITYASYSKGWWDEETSCVNLKGEKNVTFEYVKGINSVLHSDFGTEILKYDYLYTGVHGDIDSSDDRIKSQLMRLRRSEIPSLPEIDITSDKSVVAGYFTKGDAFAVLVVNSHDPFDSAVTANVRLETGGMRKATVFGGSKIEGSTETAGDITIVGLTIEGGQGALVTLQTG